MKRIKSYSEKKGLQLRDPKMIKESTEFVSAVKELESDFDKVKKLIKNSSITALEVWLELGVKSGAIKEKEAEKLMKEIGEAKVDEAEDGTDGAGSGEAGATGELSPEAEAALDKELEDALKMVIKELPADLKAIADGGEIDLTDKLDKEAEAELQESVNEAIGSVLVGGALALPAITKIVGKAAGWAGKKLDNETLKAFGAQAEHLGEKLHHKYEGLLDKMLSPFTKHMDEKKRHIVNKVLFYAIIATVGGIGVAGALKAAGAGQAGLAAVEGGLSGIKASEIAAVAQSVLPRVVSGVVAAEV